MAVSGNSVVPNYTIEPKILVARLEAKLDNSQELKMKVRIKKIIFYIKNII